MKTTIIMPSIRVPQNLSAWAALLEPDTDEIIIAGNERSPHTEIMDAVVGVQSTFGVAARYLHPEDPDIRGYAINEFTPANHTVRRNLALLEALRDRPDILVSLDDDNFPYKPTWLNGVKELLDPEHRSFRPVVSSYTNWWNAGNLCRPPVIHRGFPLTRWREQADTTFINAPGTNVPRIGVVASLWYGDPDINAVERLLSDPEVTGITGSVVLANGTWCPFDSQSTAVAGDLADMMFMWPGVGRYDDIWSSYVMRACMDVIKRHVTYGMPAVMQDRNPHNVLRDLEDELHGYKHTEEFTDLLRGMVTVAMNDDHAWEPYEVFHWMMLSLANRWGSDIIPSYTRDAMLAWLVDVDSIRGM